MTNISYFSEVPQGEPLEDGDFPEQLLALEGWSVIYPVLAFAYSKAIGPIRQAIEGDMGITTTLTTLRGDLQEAREWGVSTVPADSQYADEELDLLNLSIVFDWMDGTTVGIYENYLYEDEELAANERKVFSLNGFTVVVEEPWAEPSAKPI